MGGQQRGRCQQQEQEQEGPAGPGALHGCLPACLCWGVCRESALRLALRLAPPLNQPNPSKQREVVEAVAERALAMHADGAAAAAAGSSRREELFEHNPFTPNRTARLPLAPHTRPMDRSAG